MYELYSENKVSNNNFIILPCDLITNLPPQVIIEAYRNKNDSDLGLVIAYKNQLDIEDKKAKIFPQSYTIYSDTDENGNESPVFWTHTAKQILNFIKHYLSELKCVGDTLQQPSAINC